MPNWCSNTLTLTHEDADMIRRAREAFRAGRLLDEFIPVPAELKDTVAGGFGDAEKQAALEARNEANIAQHGYANWYDFCVSEWGTKWDVGGGDDSDYSEDADHSVTFSFDSAWAPPVAAYEKLERLGFAVQGYYYESGMAFAGLYADGEDDYFEFSGMTSEQVKDLLPKDLDDMFAISDCMADWEDEEDLDPEVAAAALDEMRAELDAMIQEESNKIPPDRQ